MLRPLRRLAAVIACAACFAATPSCATVAAYLPTVIAAVTDGALVVQGIERFADRYFERRPDPDLQKKTDIAIARVRSALDLALHAASAADAHNRADVDKAMVEVRAAYTALVALLRPIGLMTDPGGGALKALPGDRLLVPDQLTLTLRVAS